MKTISLNDAVKLVMARTGMSRRKAERQVLEMLESGKVRSRAYVIEKGPGGEMISSGRKEDLPAEFWRGASTNIEASTARKPRRKP